MKENFAGIKNMELVNMKEKITLIMDSGKKMSNGDTASK